MNLTKHFTLEELVNSCDAKRLGINNKPTSAAQKRLDNLCKLILEPLREAWGQPIVVTSGYRCKTLNAKVGGSSTSDHVYGNAADIRTVSDLPQDNKKLFDLAVKLMEKGTLRNVKQIIDEYNYNWIHISYQDGRTAKRNQILHLS